MADVKITELPIATEVNAADILPIVQDGTTKQAAASLLVSEVRMSIIDLGMVSLRDASINGRNVPVVDAAPGRLIKAVHFVPSVIDPADIGTMTFYFATPNTYDGVISGIGGYGSVGQFNPMSDTAGLLVSTFNADVGNEAGNTSVLGDTGNTASMSQICDCGPLIFAPGPVDTGLLPIGTWQPNHAYALADYVLDSNGNDQLVTTNGVSGGTEPGWATSGDTTDGTVTWHIENEAGPPTAEVHVIVEVIEGVSPMPLYPASLEWISPPVETPAGDPIPDIIVMVKDQNGDPYKFFSLSMRIDIVGAGTMTPTPQEAMDKATGLVTFSGVSIAEVGTYIIRARMVLSLVADPIFSDPFNIT